MRPDLRPLVVSGLAVLLLAGCFGGGAGEARATRPVETQVVDEEGRPIAFAPAAAFSGTRTVAILSANRSGILETQLPAEAARIVVGGGTYETQSFAVKDLPRQVVLSNASADPTIPGLSFGEPVMMTCPASPTKSYKDTVLQYDSCGGGEPVLEIASDGTIWISSTQIVGLPTAIWVSRDQGETFEQLEGQGTGLARDTVGTEGDFAIDDAGNVYFFDILVGANWFTSYTGSGEHRWTTQGPSYPGSHDRPWVRAGAADEVFTIHSSFGTNVQTAFQKSRDGGLTWDPLSIRSFPCLGNAGQGPTRDQLYIVTVMACGISEDRRHSPIRFFLSVDRGDTWTAEERVPLPVGEFEAQGNWGVVNPVADDAGNVYVAYSHASDAQGSALDIHLNRRGADGNWTEALRLDVGGTNVFPWVSAGRDGHVGLAWYHTDAGPHLGDQGDATWRLMTAASVDASSATPHFQVVVPDVPPVWKGAGVYLPGPDDENRELIKNGSFLDDFLGTEITPDGRLAVAYSSKVAPEPIRVHFLQSDLRLDLSRAVYLNGPK